MIKYVLNSSCAFFFLVIVYSCTNKSSKEIVQSPLDIKKDEIKNVVSKSLISIGRPVIRPVFFEVEKNKKPIQDGFVVYLALKNNAKLTTYEDIKLAIIYIDKTGKKLDQEIIIVNKTLKPGVSLDVENALHDYKQTAYKVILLSANALK